VTGFLVHDAAEMAAAIGECGRIDPALCRARAIDRFPETQTIARYLAMYERLLRQ
jgi:hypothetical protein